MKTSDDLADELSAHFNAIDWAELADQLDLAADPPSYEAKKTTQEIVIDLEAADVAVFVLPGGESETAFDRGDACREEISADVYIHAPLTLHFDRPRALEFVRALRYSLRGTEFAGYRWEKTETTDGIFDPAAIKHKKHFLTVFRATYFSFA